MSCYACTKQYGFFCKEAGCPNCGFSFCTKCLKKEIEVPKFNNKKQKVCLKCFEILSKVKEQSDFLAAQNIKTTLADNQIFNITEPLAAPILEPVHNAEEVFPDIKDTPEYEIKQNLDSEITKRLADLKADIPSTSIDKKMAERLADLKGEEYKQYHNKDILVSKDTRTDQEKIHDLLKQFVEEKNIDEQVNENKIDPVKDIERRLASLRGQNVNSISNSIPKDESRNVNKIVQRYMDEAKLPDFEFSEEQEMMAVSKNSDLEELPFCVICNEDAVIRCLDCDNDIYCKNCFKEIHNDEEYRSHKTKNYVIPPKFKENHF
ncbi:abscission/NoCut checkpoint regulator [Condylostylus longicornis]|uniref:abscission/NoCut checkpoint regulator n=1 Tax=Condylostylus longicornis TaxID=2530218 RepID=UPI00244E59AA|nr:abscission/NoCut checkpoint regulator [Condylostylus longicornis]